MTIDEYTISFFKNGKETIKNIPVGYRTSFFSNENSTGKTTLLKSILYCLGFEIQSTPGVNFDDYLFRIKLINNGNVYHIERKNTTFSINGQQFDLPVERHLAHSVLFNTPNTDILDNILATFFFDQDYGWTIIGYGNFSSIGTYNLASLLDALNDFDDDGLKKDILNISNAIKKYKFIIQATEKRKKFITNDSGDVCLEDDNQQLQYLNAKLSDIESKIKKRNSDISKIESTLKKNKRFSSYVSEMNLSVVDPNTGNTIPINESTLAGLSDIREALTYRKLILQGEREKLKREKETIASQIPKYTSLVDVKSEADKFYADMSGVDVDGLRTIISQLETEKRQKIEKLRELQSIDNRWIIKFLSYVEMFAKEIGDIPSDYYSSSKFIYMKKRPTISGAILHKISLCYHLAAVKVCEDKLGFNIPLIIDSPSGREVVETTIEKTFELLKEHFDKNQLLFATIKDVGEFFKDLTVFNPEKKVFDFE